MPEFDSKSCDRIAATVLRVEGHFTDESSPGGHPFDGGAQLEWFQLTSGFSGSPREADANPGKWSASADSGKGELTADTEVTRKVRDTTGGSAAGTGQWVLCRAIGSVNGTVWEVVNASGPKFAWATTTAAVGPDDATFTVTDIIPFGGSEWTGDDPLTVTNTSDGWGNAVGGWKIASGARGKIVSFVDENGDTQWAPIDFDWDCE